jgi:dipeptidyl aminopeptidase/acylaminoacyl peptidase
LTYTPTPANLATPQAAAQTLLSLPSARATDVDAAGRVLVRQDSSGRFQLYELDPGGDAGGSDPASLRQLTDLADAVDGAYLPGSRRAVISVDRGGNERAQLYLIDLDGPVLTDLDAAQVLAVDPRYVHQLAGVAPDGSQVAYVSNRRNGVDFDVWVLDVVTRDQACLYDRGGYCQPSSGFSPDGRWLSFARPGPRSLDQDLVLVEVATGVLRVVDAHPDEAAVVGPPTWLDTTSFVASTSVGADFRALVRFDAERDGREVIVEGPYDHNAWASADGSTLLVVANDNGASRVSFVDPSTGAPLGELVLPEPGVIAEAYGFPAPRLAADGSSVTFTFTSPVRPAGVWYHDRASGTTRELTAAAAIEPALLTAPSQHRLASFDGEVMSIYLYRPEAAAPQRHVEGIPTEPAEVTGSPGGPTPVVLLIHGGPESQSMLTFSPMVQAFVSAGVAVVVPNVRGSTGYGKRYSSLDDTIRRLDSVADLAAIHGWLVEVGLDPTQAGLFGGSYGGYMVLAGCAFQPDLWAVGIDEVGMSDLTTFLENTSPYRRAQREREYGSLARDRAFLESVSPLRRVEQIKAPLFVIHGANDPRVPLSETEQLVASLRRRGVRCELSVYADEGHGLTKLANKLDAYPRALQFFLTAVGTGGAGK